MLNLACKRASRSSLLQIRVEDLKHSDIPDARVVEFLQSEARNGKCGKQPLAGVIAERASFRDAAGELEAGAQQRSCCAEAGSIGGMRVYGTTVARLGDVALRSTGLVVNELTGANDDLMDEFLCHSGDVFAYSHCRVYIKRRGAPGAPSQGSALLSSPLLSSPHAGEVGPASSVCRPRRIGRR